MTATRPTLGRSLASFATTAVLVALVAGACSSGRTGAAPTETGVDLSVAEQVASVGPLADVPAASLREPEATRRTDQLVRQAAQNTPLCSLVELLDDLTEPDPTDVEALTAYASRSYNLLFGLDPRSKVNDINQLAGNVRRVPVPADIVAAIDAQRRAMYAHFVRLTVAGDMHDEGLIDDEQLQARLDDAFVRLVQSEYTAADRRLEEFRQRGCGNVSGVA